MSGGQKKPNAEDEAKLQKKNGKKRNERMFEYVFIILLKYMVKHAHTMPGNNI